MPLVVLVFVSAFWSVSFTWTLYYASMFAANVVVAYAIALVVTPERFVRILAVTMGALIVASFAFLIVMPDLAMSSRWEGGWIAGIQFNGVFSHKSTSGIYFGLFLIVLWMSNVVTGFWRLVATAVTMLALLLTNSATGSVGAVILLVVFQSLRLAGFPTHVYMPLVGLLVFLFASFVPLLSFGEATELVGRDAGLTGRSPIWAAAGEYFLERPLLGYGYNGFFHPGDLSPVWRLWSLDRYFQTPHFHNSTIDVAISLGAVGVFVYGLTVMAGYLVTTNISMPIETRRGLAGALTMMVFSTAFDMTIMAHNTFGTTLLFYCFYAGQIDYRR
jgi:O-antigen ligase